jgi:hypothetical protein
LVEEKKAETELEMKKQIKFLLEHYLRAKELQDTSNIPLAAFASNKDVPEFQSQSSEDAIDLQQRMNNSQEHAEFARFQPLNSSVDCQFFRTSHH